MNSSDQNLGLSINKLQYLSLEGGDWFLVLSVLLLFSLLFFSSGPLIWMLSSLSLQVLFLDDLCQSLGLSQPDNYYSNEKNLYLFIQQLLTEFLLWDRVSSRPCYKWWKHLADPNSWLGNRQLTFSHSFKHFVISTARLYSGKHQNMQR